MSPMRISFFMMVVGGFVVVLEKWCLQAHQMMRILMHEDNGYIG